MIEIEDLEVSNASFTFFRKILNRFEENRFKSIQNLAKIKTHNTNKGTKVYYRCRINNKCTSQMHLHYSSSSERILFLKRSQGLCHRLHH